MLVRAAFRLPPDDRALVRRHAGRAHRAAAPRLAADPRGKARPDLGADRVRAFADYLRAIDPYDHPVTVHSAGDPVEKLAFTFGDPRFSITSVQLSQRPIDTVTEAFRARTAAAGRPFPASMDEFTLDVGHLHVYGTVSPETWWVELGDGILEVHLHDNDTFGDEHMPIGEGAIDWKRTFEDLFRHAPDAVKVIEVPVEGALKSLTRIRAGGYADRQLELL